MPTQPDEHLIEQYIDLSASLPGVEEARLLEYGIPVWALIGHFRATGNDARQVAADYEVPVAAVEAALAYYRQHRAAIDARIAANAA